MLKRTDTILLRIEPEVKQRLYEFAKSQRYSMNGLILKLIDDKISEVENAN